MEINNKEYESISKTAIVTSYPRTFTDIPYEKEIFRWLEKNSHSESISLDKMLAPEIEARYKLTNRLLDETDIKQVVELAAGYSSRGLIYSGKGFTYIELDLENVAFNKRNMLNSISNIPENLHILSGNALSKNDIEKCKTYIKNDKIAVINEGLLRYLTFEEKKIVAENVYSILSEYGGVWITCDVTPKNFLKSQDKNLPDFNKNLSNVSDRNNINDRFENKEHIIDFFGKIGFEVEFHYFKEVKDILSSPAILGISSERTDELLEHAMVVKMKINK